MDDPVDRGGHTCMGITEHTAREAHKNGLIASPKVTDLTKADAEKIYFHCYYRPSMSHIMDWPLGLAHFDAAVNHGVGRAGMLLQDALNSMNTGPNAYMLKVDGAVGPKTLGVLHDVLRTRSPQVVTQRQMDIRREFYHAIIRRRPDQERFFRGWMNRLKWLKEAID